MSAVVTLLFLLQAVSIGFATGATANDGAGFFGAVCQTAAVEASKSEPSPIKQHHVGPCCILHCSSVIEADGERAPVEILPLEMFSAPPASTYQIDAAIAAPELRPLSPRAPPAHFV